MIRHAPWPLTALATLIQSPSDLIVENLALRQKLAVFKDRKPRPRLAAGNRLFWIALWRLLPLTNVGAT